MPLLNLAPPPRQSTHPERRTAAALTSLLMTTRPVRCEYVFHIAEQECCLNPSIWKLAHVSTLLSLS